MCVLWWGISSHQNQCTNIHESIGLFIEHKKNLGKVLETMESFFKGLINKTLERHKFNLCKQEDQWYLLKRGMTWNDQQQPTMSKKQPERTYNEQETTWNDLQQPEKTYSEQEMTWLWPTTGKKQPEMKRPTTSKTQPTTTQTYLQRAKKRHETTNNSQISRLFYDMGQSVLFSITFSTQHLVAIIQALLHRESWWK